MPAAQTQLSILNMLKRIEASRRCIIVQFAELIEMLNGYIVIQETQNIS